MFSVSREASAPQVSLRGLFESIYLYIIYI